MRCKDVERLILEVSERSLEEEERIIIEEHTQLCPACASFRESLGEIRSALNNIPAPPLPQDMEERTRMRCYAEMRSQRDISTSRSPLTRAAQIPGLIWGALIFLTVITVIIVVPQARDLRIDQSMSFADIAALSLILQNAVMLILAPLVLRKFGQKSQDLKLI